MRRTIFLVAILAWLLPAAAPLRALSCMELPPNAAEKAITGEPANGVTWDTVFIGTVVNAPRDPNGGMPGAIAIRAEVFLRGQAEETVRLGEGDAVWTSINEVGRRYLVVGIRQDDGTLSTLCGPSRLIADDADARYLISLAASPVYLDGSGPSPSPTGGAGSADLLSPALIVLVAVGAVAGAVVASALFGNRRTAA
ncbi:MAG: hypothetical protein A2X23_10830 [Chloroflexi bacterium GWC2_73_18]|nr:MAG: hypothetical protein A2X23_10830 [Chloroflexi bacterium GWC2_73_18]